MKNRVIKETDRIIIDDGTESGPWFKLTWESGTLVVDSFDELRMTHKTVRELTDWIQDAQIVNQSKRASKANA